MPYPTERVTIPAQHHPEYSGFNGALYSLPYSRKRLHALSVPGVDPGTVVVQKIQDIAAANAENMLAAPVALLYLNRVLEWFDWSMPTVRAAGLYLALDKPRKLMAEVTRDLEIDFAQRTRDEAYTMWREKNPKADDQEYLDLIAKRIRDGKVHCRVSDCFEPVLPKDYLCADHQRLKKIE